MTTPDPVIFDPQKRAATGDLRAAVSRLTAFLEDREEALGTRQRARKEDDRKRFAVAIDAIVSNIAVLPLLAPGRPLAVPMSSGVMWRTGRYENPVYGQHFRDALSLMARPEVDLIEVVARGFRFASGESRQTTIKPKPVFGHYIPPSLIGWEALRREHETEVLILKGAKDRVADNAEFIDYKESRATARMRREVERINVHLRAAPLLIIDAEASGARDEERQPVDFTRRTVRRIFNNGSWREGGRLFDGFWESMRRADRFRCLKICTKAHPDGEPIANVDFSQLFPTLAYQRAGHERPHGDLYAIQGQNDAREGIKKLMNAMLFAKGPLTRWPMETSALFPKGTKLADVVHLITSAHGSIAHLFGSGVGFSLMFAESNILIEALLGLYAKGITALPLHDSVLVAASEAERAKDMMQRAYEMATGFAESRLKVDIG